MNFQGNQLSRFPLFFLRMGGNSYTKGFVPLVVLQKTVSKFRKTLLEHKVFLLKKKNEEKHVYPYILTLLHSERPKLYGVLAVLSAIGLINLNSEKQRLIDLAIPKCCEIFSHGVDLTGQWL